MLVDLDDLQRLIETMYQFIDWKFQLETEKKYLKSFSKQSYQFKEMFFLCCFISTDF